MKWVLGVSAAIVALAIAALVVVPYVVDTPRVQALIAGSVSQAIGRPVRFSGIAVRPLPLPSVELRGLEVADDPRFGSTPFLKLEKGTLRLGLLALLRGRVEITQVILNQPSIALIQDGQGQWNIASLGVGADGRGGPGRGARGGAGGGGAPGGSGTGLGAAGAVLGSQIRIDKGFVSYTTRKGTPASYRVEELDLKLRGSGTQISLDGDLRVKPGDLRVRIAKGALTLPPSRVLFDSPVQAEVSLDGKDIAGLVAATLGPEPALAGSLKGTLAVTGSLGAPRVAGDVEVPSLRVTQTRPACPEPKTRSLTVSALKLAARWESSGAQVRPFTAALGRGKISTNVTATEGGTRMALADVVVTGVPLETLLVDFMCEGYAVTGPLDLTGAFTLRPKDMLKSLAGNGRFSVGRGKVVGPRAIALFESVIRVGGALSSVLATDVPTSLGSSPLEFESITATYEIAGGVVTTRDLVYTSRAMKVGVKGQYALAAATMDLDVVVTHARGQVAARVTGTAEAPMISVAPSSIVRGLDRDTLRGLSDLLKRFR